jgi:cyclase
VSSDHYRFEQVADGAWAAVAVDAGAGVGNAGFALLEDGTSLVVDCGFTPAAAREVRAAAEEHLGPVGRLVVTHGDLDHYGGAQVFADVPIVATEQTQAAVESKGPARVAEMLEGMPGYLAELEEKGAPEWERLQGERVSAQLPSMTITPPTELFSDELDLGGALVFECGRGHTESDSVVWLPEQRVLYSADLIGVDGHLNMSRGDPENWLTILDRLVALGPRTVVPGHGPPAGAEAVAVARDYIETLLELAANPGKHELPEKFAGWTFPEGFQQNIAALRAR